MRPDMKQVQPLRRPDHLANLFLYVYSILFSKKQTMRYVQNQSTFDECIHEKVEWSLYNSYCDSETRQTPEQAQHNRIDYIGKSTKVIE